jgi:hypothetical protein
MNPFQSLRDYETFVCTLQQRFLCVRKSTLVVVQRGKRTATFPHHKHISPNIKHHRVPAPEMSFTRPNLPAFIQEVEELLNN